MKIVFVLFGLLFGAVPEALWLVGENLVQGYVKPTADHAQPNRYNGHGNVWEKASTHVRDVGTSKQYRVKRADAKKSTAGLEKDTDDPDGVVHTLSELKAMKPGPGVQRRSEMPVTGKENSRDLKRKKRRAHEFPEGHVNNTSVVVQDERRLLSSKEKHLRTETKYGSDTLRLNKNMNTTIINVVITSNIPSHQRPSESGQDTVAVYTNNLPHQSRHLATDSTVIEARRFENDGVSKQVTQNTTLSQDSKNTQNYNVTIQDIETQMEHRIKRQTDPDVAKDVALSESDQFWNSGVKYVDNRPTDNENSEKKNTSDSELDDIPATMTFRERAFRKKWSQRRNKTKRSRAESRPEKREKIDNDWLKKELMLIEMESRALKYKAAQLHNKLRKANFNFKEAESKNRARRRQNQEWPNNRQDTRAIYSKLFKRIENKELQPGLKRIQNIRATEHRVEKLLPESNSADLLRQRYITHALMRLERDMRDLKNVINTQERKEVYSRQIQTRFYNADNDRDTSNTNYNSQDTGEEPSGRYKREAIGSYQGNNTFFRKLNSVYKDYHFQHFNDTNRNQTYKCGNGSRCQPIKQKGFDSIYATYRRVHGKGHINSIYMGNPKKMTDKGSNLLVAGGHDKDDNVAKMNRSYTNKYAFIFRKILKKYFFIRKLSTNKSLAQAHTINYLPLFTVVSAPINDKRTGENNKVRSEKLFLPMLSAALVRKQFNRFAQLPFLEQHHENLEKCYCMFLNSLAMPSHASKLGSAVVKRIAVTSSQGKAASQGRRANSIADTYFTEQTVHIIPMRTGTTVDRQALPITLQMKPLLRLPLYYRMGNSATQTVNKRSKMSIFTLLTFLNSRMPFILDLPNRYRMRHLHNLSPGNINKKAVALSLFYPKHYFQNQRYYRLEVKPYKINTRKSMTAPYGQILHNEPGRWYFNKEVDDFHTNVLRRVLSHFNKHRKERHNYLHFLDYYLLVPVYSSKIRRKHIQPDITNIKYVTQILINIKRHKSHKKLHRRNLHLELSDSRKNIRLVPELTNIWLVTSNRTRHKRSAGDKDPETQQEVSMKEYLDNMFEKLPDSDKRRDTEFIQPTQEEPEATDSRGYTDYVPKDSDKPLIDVYNSEDMFSPDNRFRRQAPTEGDQTKLSKLLVKHSSWFPKERKRTVQKGIKSSHVSGVNVANSSRLTVEESKDKQNIRVIQRVLDNIIRHQQELTQNAYLKSLFGTAMKRNYLDNHSSSQNNKTFDKQFLIALTRRAFQQNYSRPGISNFREVRASIVDNGKAGADNIRYSHRNNSMAHNQRMDYAEYNKTLELHKSKLSGLINASKMGDNGLLASNVSGVYNDNSTFGYRSQGNVTRGNKQKVVVDYFNDNDNLDKVFQSDLSAAETVSTDTDTDNEEKDNSVDTEAPEGIKVDAKGQKIEPTDEFAFVEKEDVDKLAEYKYTWSEWSECSVSCGIGQRFRFNRCQNNQPCTGETASSETEVCSIKDDC